MKKHLPPLSSAKNTWRWWVISGVVGWLILMVVIRVQSFVPVGNLTRDPAAIALHPPYYGALSNLGILMWSASAAVCALSSALLKQLTPAAKSRYFLTVFAGLSAVLCLDDTFLLHEAVLPNRLPVIQIPEPLIILVYILVLLGVIVYFRQLLLKTSLWPLGISLFLFALALGTDIFLPEERLSADDFFWIEDGLKLLGIFLWMSYFFRTSLELVVAAMPSQSSDLLIEERSKLSV